MSDYTTQIRFICESKSGLTESVGFSGIMEAIENSVDDIFNFEWPIFDEAYRVPLEIKILRHFYTREIGEETFGLWQLRLCDRLNVIMPYYNQLYKSELIKFNPMYDVDLTTEHERANDGVMNRSEHANFSREDQSERDNRRNAVDDGSNETNFVGNKNSRGTNEQIEGMTSNNASEGQESSASNSKNWASNITNNNSVNEGNRRNKNVNRFSDTPQGNVSIGNAPEGSTGGTDGNADTDSVFGDGYLTNVTIVDDRTNTKDENKSESLSDDTSEGLANQTINRNDNTTNKTDRSLSGTDDRADSESSSTKNYTSNVHDSNENEKVVGSGSHTNDVTGKTTTMNTEDFIQRVSGKRGGLTYSKMLDEFRKTFLNIDRMILNDLESLFIGLWE